MKRRMSLRHRQPGMALIAVLWIVAALSLLVVGMAQTVRQQIRVASTQRDEVVGQALGEAAVALTLQALQVAPERPRGVVQVPQEFEGVKMSVEVMPLDGLISLNGASAPLFTAALKIAGGMDASAAEALANSLVQWREEPAEGGGKHLFESVEDLLLVPGFDYLLYERLRPLFTAITRANGVNPLSAPPEVLAVLADGDMSRVSAITERRSNNAVGVDTSSLNQSLVGRSAADQYRVSAKVPLEAGRILLLTRDVGLTATPSGEPWRVFSATRRILPASSS